MVVLNYSDGPLFGKKEILVLATIISINETMAKVTMFATKRCWFLYYALLPD